MIQAGDRVAYAAKWLRSCGLLTGEVPRLRGVVQEVKHWRGGHPAGVAVVKWDGVEEPMHILAVNLAKVGTPAMSVN